MQFQSSRWEDTVVVTGFGPFGNHDVNASWEAVKLVPSENLEVELNAQILIQNIPVAYGCVSEMVPAIWKTHNPVLVVHVGVSSIANCITLENCARNLGYTESDIQNHSPEGGVCCTDGPVFIACSLDLARIAEEVEKTTGLKACTSLDAGRYLCEFTYYLSLNNNPASSVFVHVPVLDEKHTAQKLSDAIRVILCESLKEARKHKAKMGCLNGN